MLVLVIKFGVAAVAVVAVSYPVPAFLFFDLCQVSIVFLFFISVELK
jgi:hypothetical protein